MYRFNDYKDDRLNFLLRFSTKASKLAQLRYGPISPHSLADLLTPLQIITLVLAFLTICAGITLLQLSRVDPKKLNVDEKTNLLLAANQQEIENPDEQDPEKAIEDPGMLIPMHFW